MGGFTGPDLTNVASRLAPAQIATALRGGVGLMPALGLPEAEIAALQAFLAELDRPDLGRGELRLGGRPARWRDLPWWELRP
jgi:hypothetical protein